MKHINELFEHTDPHSQRRIIIPVADIVSLRYQGCQTEIETVSGQIWCLAEHDTWASAYLEMEQLKEAIFS